jgi:hypothetical protein
VVMSDPRTRPKRRKNVRKRHKRGLKGNEVGNYESEWIKSGKREDG